MSVRLSQAPIIDRHVDLTSLSIQSEKAVTTFTDTHFFNKLVTGRRNRTLFKTKTSFSPTRRTSIPIHSSLLSTTSKRLADRKIEKFDKNITKRGFVPETTTKKGKDYPVGPILLGFFVFVVIGSSLFQIIRTATSGGMA
ncbi:hypothetical protein YC2023_096451 [Brassica napus]